MSSGPDLRIGLLGLGQVGGGVAQILKANGTEIEARLEAPGYGPCVRSCAIRRGSVRWIWRKCR